MGERLQPCPLSSEVSDEKRTPPMQPIRHVMLLNTQQDLVDWHWWRPTLAPLLSTSAMQRLMSIAQLGFVERVWPTANHTRFSHSLGSYQMARQVIESLTSITFPQGGALFSRQQIQTFLLAALLHDIGHYPFSHSLDSLAQLLPPHERVGRALIEQSELATLLERDYQISPARVADLIDPPFQPAAYQERTAGDFLLRQLLAGPCDVDKLDYVVRDARACRLISGQFPEWRLRQSLRIVWTDSQTEPRLALALEALGVLRAWIQLRHRLYMQVYWHPTNRAYATMLARAVQDALESAALSISWLQQTTDVALLDALCSSAMPRSTRMLARNIASASPYQSILEITPQQSSLFPHVFRLAQDAQRRTWAEQQLASLLAGQFRTEIAEHEVLLDIVQPKDWDLNGWVVFHQPLDSMPACLSWPQALGFAPGDLARSTQRPARVLVAPHLATLFRGQAYCTCIVFLEQILASRR